MSSPRLSRLVVNSLKAILGEDYNILAFERLSSRRNEVYKITGALPSQAKPSPVVAKYYKNAGIANETSILREAHQHKLHVPTIIGTTAEVLVLEYIDAPNLCDLITLKPDILLGKMLASWLAQYHSTFSKEKNQVLLKGDARIRNFLVEQDHLVGVDFEESQYGSYTQDLAVACASILDTAPLFTESKLRLCTVILDHYTKLRQIPNSSQLTLITQAAMIQVLQETASRRGNPAELCSHITRFAKGALQL